MATPRKPRRKPARQSTSIYVSEHERAITRRAADLLGDSWGRFVLRAAVQEARRVLRELPPMGGADGRQLPIPLYEGSADLTTEDE